MTEFGEQQTRPDSHSETSAETEFVKIVPAILIGMWDKAAEHAEAVLARMEKGDRFDVTELFGLEYTLIEFPEPEGRIAAVIQRMRDITENKL
jgi:hypothetical protein